MATLNFFKLTFLLSSLLLISHLQAATPPPPPPEAIAACSGLDEGNRCSFTHPQGTLEGICANIVTQLACAPEGKPNSGDNPPPEGGNPGDDDRPDPIAVDYDARNGKLFLPIVSIDNSLFFQVSLKLVNLDPVVFNLDEIAEVDNASQVAATYDVTTETLLVPAFNYGSKHYRLILKLIDDELDFQFELTSMEEID